LLPQSGLALVGALLQDSKLRQRIDALDVEGCPRPEVKHGEVVAAAIGLLCLGKSDFNDIEANTWWTSLKFSAKLLLRNNLASAIICRFGFQGWRDGHGRHRAQANPSLSLPRMSVTWRC